MFNYIRYQATGFDLRTTGNNPSSVRIIVIFTPLEDKLRMKKEFEVIFDLDDINKMSVPVEARLIINELKSMENAPYKDWIKKAMRLSDLVRHHLKKKGIKLYF